MLDLRPECERCHAALSTDSLEARWCAHGCTFCSTCTDGDLKGVCPNCGGELLPRPRLSVPPRTPPACAPRRVICLGQEAAETLVLLGLEDRIVGVSRHVDRPGGGYWRDREAAGKVARLGGFGKADAAALAALEPDLVLLYSDVQADLAGELARLGSSLRLFNHTTLAGTLAMVRELGRTMGVPDRGEALARRLEARLELARAHSAAPPAPRVWFEEWDQPLVAGVPWIAELIELAGGTPVPSAAYAGSGAKQRVVDPQDVLAAAPDVILASWCGKPFDQAALEARPGWSELPAVRSGHVHGLPGEPLLAPGPSLILEGLDLLVRCVDGARHPSSGERGSD